jgi:catechol-2,3-dioxygenase
MFSSGRTHHELLLLAVGKDAAPIPQGHRLGLYHIALKVGDTDDELREALQHITNEGVTMVGSADHGVTHSLYIKDPDGNEIELYVDVDATWREHPEAVAASGTRPLRL